MQYLHDHIDDLLLGLDPSTPSVLQPSQPGVKESFQEEPEGPAGESDAAAVHSADPPGPLHEDAAASSGMPQDATQAPGSDAGADSAQEASNEEHDKLKAGAATLSAVDGAPIDSGSLQNAGAAPEDAVSSGQSDEQAVNASSDGLRAIEMSEGSPSEEDSGPESSRRHKYLPDATAGPIAESTEQGDATPDMNTDACVLEEHGTSNGAATMPMPGKDPTPEAGPPAEGLEGCIVDNYVTVRAPCCPSSPAAHPHTVRTAGS